jgi:hypothetical protein
MIPVLSCENSLYLSLQVQFYSDVMLHACQRREAVDYDTTKRSQIELRLS